MHKQVIVHNLLKNGARGANPGILSKYIWLANYYNSFIAEKSGLDSDEIQKLIIDQTVLKFGI